MSKGIKYLFIIFIYTLLSETDVSQTFLITNTENEITNSISPTENPTENPINNQQPEEEVENERLYEDDFINTLVFLYKKHHQDKCLPPILKIGIIIEHMSLPDPPPDLPAHQA